MTLPGATLSRAHRSAIGATHLGITLAEYQAHIDAGMRWCCACHRWHPFEQMAKRASKREGIDNICKRVAAEKARVSIARRRAKQGWVKTEGY